MTDAAWKRGVRITTAAAANAVPVAEFVLSQTIFSLKRGWEYIRLAKGGSSVHWLNKPVPGMYGSKVGIVALGQIGRKTCELLKPFDVEVLACSIDTPPGMAEELGVTLVSIEEIFSTCDVVSIHLPFIDATRGMIGKELLSLMKPNSTFINTARGAVVNQAELIGFLRERPDVYACIDVTEPDPPSPDCPLLHMPNVVLTPHLAGAMGSECPRLGQYMLDELDRYLSGQPLEGEVAREMAGMLA
jgi:phosphoglycerate dehydrogenase-like enzyme